MKKESTLRTLIGIKQQDMAGLLYVSRTRFSMFETGKRSLPVASMEFFAEMLVHLTASNHITKSLFQSEQYQTLLQKQIERLLLENERQQWLVVKKINAATKKYEAKLKMLQLSEFLTSRPAKKGVLDTGMLKSFTNKASKMSEAKGFTRLIELQFQQELLVIQGQLLQSKAPKNADANGFA